MNPGSKEATDKGCTCPVLDNHHGRGVSQGGKEPLFWKNEHCPLHGVEAEMEKSNCDNKPLRKDCSKDAIGFIEIKGINETITIGCYEE